MLFNMDALTKGYQGGSAGAQVLKFIAGTEAVRVAVAVEHNLFFSLCPMERKETGRFYPATHHPGLTFSPPSSPELPEQPKQAH